MFRNVSLLGSATCLLAAAPSPDESRLVYRGYATRMVPVEESACLGAAPLEDNFGFQAGRLRSGKYAGGGCVVRAYSRVVHERYDFVNGRLVFRVRAVMPGTPENFAEWSGTIRGDSIYGEVTFTTAGEARRRDDIEHAIAAIWQDDLSPGLLDRPSRRGFKLREPLRPD